MNKLSTARCGNPDNHCCQEIALCFAKTKMLTELLTVTTAGSINNFRKNGRILWSSVGEATAPNPRATKDGGRICVYCRRKIFVPSGFPLSELRSRSSLPETAAGKNKKKFQFKKVYLSD